MFVVSLLLMILLNFCDVVFYFCSGNGVSVIWIIFYVVFYYMMYEVYCDWILENNFFLGFGFVVDFVVGLVVGGTAVLCMYFFDLVCIKLVY